ncbi:MAG: BamA/TamA family outer membrane protein [Bacteroidia bacterium]|nr:BamA/TamA family outer membrane protein [Bacteroidia bacterium]
MASQILTLDSIEVTGNKRTKSFTLLRELPVKVGDQIPLADLEKVKESCYNNAYNTQLFTRVDVSHTIEGSSLTLKFEVRERWYIWPVAYVSFEERSFNEWWQNRDLDRLVYGGGLIFENLTGRHDDMSVYGQLGYSRRFSMGYQRPFLFPKAKIGAEFGYNYVNYKEIGFGTKDSYLQLARLKGTPMQIQHLGYVEFFKRFTPRKKLLLGAMFNYFNPSDSILEYNDRYLTTGSNNEYYPSIYLSYRNDQRDWASYPLSGYKYYFILRQSGLPGLGTAHFLRISMGFSHHIPLSKRWNIAYGSQNFILLGKKVPFFDKFFVGWGENVRGYERYVIDGSFINISKAELKFALIPRQMVHIKYIPLKKFRDLPVGLYLTLFSDFGYVMDETFSNFDQTLKDRMLASAGVGVNFLTMYDLLIRFEYSRNLLGQPGFQFGTKIPIR